MPLIDRVVAAAELAVGILAASGQSTAQHVLLNDVERVPLRTRLNVTYSFAPPIRVEGVSVYQPNDPMLIYAAWHRVGAAAEVHLYAHGGRGLDFRAKGTTGDHWFDEFMWWLEASGFVSGASR